MRYTPLSEEELNRSKVLTEGEAQFEVIAAKDKLSKKQNEMIELQLKVCDSKGVTGGVFDYLVSNVVWKIKRFFDSIGSPDAYLQGEMDADSLVGASGKCILKTESDPKYGDQTRIADYLKNGSGQQTKKNEDGGDIPF